LKKEERKKERRKERKKERTFDVNAEIGNFTPPK
jgi:hypothetical protein